MTITQESRASSGENPHGDGRYIPILDGWRAVAIALVLLFHGTYNTHNAGHGWFKVLAYIAGKLGALGVLIFFCISGYLITQRLLVESGEEGMFSVSNFYIKRAFRILPPLAVYLLTLLALFLPGYIALQRRDLSAPLFLANYFQGSWYTAHFWSLSVEEHFYLFWPFCIVLAGWRRAMWVGVAVITGVAAWRPWTLHHTLTGAQQAGKLQHTDLRLDYIMMGAVLALAVRFYPYIVRWLQTLGRAPGLLALLVLLILTTRLHIDTRTLQAMLLTLLVCSSSLADAPISRLLLTSRPVLFLGKVSYSLYIWQELVLAPTEHLFWGSPRALLLKYAAALALAVSSYYFVEKPFIRMGRRLATHAGTQKVAVT